jgi:hypothetical protein
MIDAGREMPRVVIDAPEPGLVAIGSLYQRILFRTQVAAPGAPAAG